MLSKEAIIQNAKENNVYFVRLQFSDIFGFLKNVTIPISQLEKALSNQMMFDGSSIDGFVRIEESDMYLRPDVSTWCVLPWGPKENLTARLICDVYNSDGTPFQGCPRYILRKALTKAKELGFEMNVGPEVEFFLFHTDAEGRPLLKTHDSAGYFDMSPVDKGSHARRDMILTLENMGFEIEASHHENAPGQHEIDFKYADALKTADNVQTFKLAVRSIAQAHNLHASFLPKPIYGIAGSGMHCNQSLFCGSQNAFYDAKAPLELSQNALYYAGGLIKHARAMAAITNPLVNSYRRLVAGYEAPIYVAWSERNRSPLIRVASARGKSTRLELRNPDPSCNPYLAFAVMLMAGLDGITNKIEPPQPVNSNIYAMTEAERIANQIEKLPGTLIEAIGYMKESKLVAETLGEHVFERYIEAKEYEWSEYFAQVSQWEIDNYFYKY